MCKWASQVGSASTPNAIMALFAGARKYTDVINLSIGYPDLPTPRPILDAMYAGSLAGHIKYAVSRGDPALIAALQSFYAEEYGLALAADRLLVTPATCAGMYEVMQAVLDAEDEVLVFEPYFPPYAAQISMAGCPCQGGFYLFPGIGAAGEGHMRLTCTRDIKTLEAAFDRLENHPFWE